VPESSTVLIDRTGTESLSITAADNIMPLLESTVVNKTLVVGPQQSTSFTTRSPIRYDITVDLSGSTTATLEGRTDRQTLNLTGSKQHRAENLVSSVVALHVTGSGRVQYIGDPTVAVTDTGSGSVSKR
jgi:hypothetical protein